jgi:hypothetical protein
MRVKHQETICNWRNVEWRLLGHKQTQLPTIGLGPVRIQIEQQRETARRCMHSGGIEMPHIARAAWISGQLHSGARRDKATRQCQFGH